MSNSARMGLGVAVVVAVGLAAWLLSGGAPDVAPGQGQGAPSAPPSKGATPKDTPDGPSAPAPVKDAKATPTAKRSPSANGDPATRAPSAQTPTEGATADSDGARGEGRGGADGADKDAGADAMDDDGDGLKPEDGPLKRALEEVAFPSIMACLQERVKRGESFDGRMLLKTTLTTIEDDPKHAEVELKSIDSNDMSDADMECLRASFEDQLVPIKSDDVRAALEEGEGARDVNMDLTLKLKAAPKPAAAPSP